MSALDSLYQQIILEQAKARHGATLTDDQAAAVHLPAGTGQCHQLNPVCGDEITLRLVVENADDGGTPASARVGELLWSGDGCSISMASASILAELAVGMTPEELAGLIEQFRVVMRSRGAVVGDEDVLGDAAALSGVAKFPARVKCAMLAWVAAEDALRQAV
ncbi:Fe-S cluster assembly sulfur transfer protein SufU [Specibacter cremeus]|uniref:Fe-S cluster assembly sulfur transfer protein SufU n=1 Tax=Specibacter cremeus TaxID=1629051 RepID=UPI000F78657E|nr:SUF system NifU family Fe-S cluster assembly protein [Specibacter cremeus]